MLIGTFLDRIRLYVGGYSVTTDLKAHEIPMEMIPATNLPDLADVLIVVGAISGSVLVYLLGTRIFPVINIWEQKELLMYKLHKPFHRTEVLVLGKPE